MADPAPDWNLKKVRAPQALKLLPRLRGKINWQEIEVAHIDTGITEHSTFGRWSNHTSPFVRIGPGQNLLEEGDQPFDPLTDKGSPGHGTRIASVLCGLPVAGSKFAGGVAPGLPIVPYRTITSVVAFNKKAQTRIARAIEHAVDHHCDVISMSLGSPMVILPSPSRLGQAVDKAYEAGIIVVAAGGQTTEHVTYPGKFSRTIGVGGTRPNDRYYWKYSLRSAPWIDVWAPGYKVIRASSILDNAGNRQESNDKAGKGSSYATVHVAAAAAMWLAYHGETKLERAYRMRWQRIEAFRSLIGSTSSPMKGSYWPTEPAGILNIEKLLEADLPPADTLDREQRRAELEWQ